MVFGRLKSGLAVTDDDFDVIYTGRVRKLSRLHFTPVAVAKIAAEFLVNKPGAKVLDVGSGAGKFCMVGAACTDGLFTGVEQRQSLFEISDSLSKDHRLANTRFVHSNVTDIDFREFDAFYFFNAFYENVFQKDPMRMDASVKMDKVLYLTYTQYMREQLCEMPVGTRLATYFSYAFEVPANSYKMLSVSFDTRLKLWEKIA